MKTFEKCTCHLFKMIKLVYNIIIPVNDIISIIPIITPVYNSI